MTTIADIPVDLWRRVLPHWLTLLDICRLRRLGRVWLALTDAALEAAGVLQQRALALSLRAGSASRLIAPCVSTSLLMDAPNGVYRLASLIVSPARQAQLRYELCYWLHRRDRDHSPSLHPAFSRASSCCLSYGHAYEMARAPLRRGADMGSFVPMAHGEISVRQALATLCYGVIAMRDAASHRHRLAPYPVGADYFAV